MQLPSTAASLLFLFDSVQAFNLWFYLGSQYNGEETALISDFIAPDQCSTEGLVVGNVESQTVLIQKQDSDLEDAEIAFYADSAYDTSLEPIVFNNNGCVSLELGVMSYVAEMP